MLAQLTPLPLIMVIGTVPVMIAPLSGAVICTTPGLAVAVGPTLVAVGVPAEGVALAVAVATGLMNCASTFRVICCAPGLTTELLGPHGLRLLKPHDHCTVPGENTVAPLAAW
jgi:hypothetical protein